MNDHRHDESQRHIETEAIPRHDRHDASPPSGSRVVWGQRGVTFSYRAIAGWITTIASVGLMGGGTIHAFAYGSPADVTEKVERHDKTLIEINAKLQHTEVMDAVRDEREKAMAKELAELHAYFFRTPTTQPYTRTNQ